MNALRSAEVQNRDYDSLQTQAASNAKVERWPHLVCGSPRRNLRIRVANWYKLSTAETDNVNSITIQAASLQAPNGAVFPLYFNGQRSITLAPGDFDIMSDAVLPAIFSYPVFPEGIYFTKSIITVPTLGGSVVTNGYVAVADAAGSQSGWYDTANTTPSSVDAAGTFTVTGTALINANSGFRPGLFGSPVTDVFCPFFDGDSIGAGFSDTTSRNIGGVGEWQRAAYNDNIVPIPSMNSSKPSARSTIAITGTKWRAGLKYVNAYIDEYLTNDASDNETAATMQTRSTTLWDIVKAAGVNTIIKVGLICRTTSTDNWSTLANQTPISAAWSSGGTVEAMGAWFLTKVADGTITAYADMLTMKDPTNVFAWRTNGSPNFLNADQVHPNTVGTRRAAKELRNRVDLVRRGINGQGLRLWLQAADASTITQVANAVSQWNDKSNNVNNVSQATGAAQPTYGATALNSLYPGISFDGGDYMSLLASLPPTNGYDMVFMGSVVDTAANKMIVAGQAGSPQFFITAAEKISSARQAQAAFTPGGTTVPVTGAPFIAGFRTTGTLPGTGTQILYNGVVDATTGTTPAFTQNVETLGATTAGGTGYSGVMAELFIFDQGSPGAAQAVTALKSEYGIA